MNYNNIKLFIIYIVLLFINNIQCSSLKFTYAHPLRIHFETANYDLSNKNNNKLFIYIKEQSKILSSLVNSINIKSIKINSKIIDEKCQKNINIPKEVIYKTDIVIIPVIEKFKKENFRIKICDDKSKNKEHPSIALFQISNNFNINTFIKTFNERYELRLKILKNLMDCLGLTLSFMRNIRKPKNNYFKMPEYLLSNSISYKSILKLYKLSQKPIPKIDINLLGDFYKVNWHKNLTLKDFRSGIINIENDMSETSFNLLNDMDYYSVSKCDLELDNFGKCHRLDQKCITPDEFNNKYYLRYGTVNFKIICYFSDENNILNNQCGIKFGPLMAEVIDYTPLIKKYNIENIKVGDYDIPELNDIQTQELTLIVPSKKCHKMMPRTIYFSDYEDEIENNTNNTNMTIELNDIMLTENQRNFFVTFQTYEEHYIRHELLKIFLLNGLYRSYVQLGNHNIFIASFPEYILKERGKNNHRINKYQKVFNHIGNEVLSKKDILYTKYKEQKLIFSKDYNYMQETYLYPEDKLIINKKFENYEISQDNLWLVKPKNGNTGKGIHIFKSLKEETNNFLITKYITNPHLINGKKYDLRIYVLVTGVKPLRIYLNKEGLVRIATEKFNLNRNNFNNNFVHLTNTGINKKNKEYVYAQDYNSEDANKWSLNTYKKYLNKENIDFNLIIEKIKDIAIKTIISGHRHLVTKLNEYNLNDTSFFNLYGFDIMIDENYQPYLLEVNRRPDMHVFDKMDKVVKEKIFIDTLNIIGMIPFSHDNKLETFDAIYKYDDKIEESVDYAYCELTRPRGSFELIFPLKDNIDIYKKYFNMFLFENERLWEKIKNDEENDDQTI